MSFSELLKQCRKKQGVSQAELASRLGVTQQAVGKWESGKSSPDPSTVARIAELLNTTADYLLGRTLSRDGAIIVADDLYDSTDEKGNLRGSIMATLQKKLVVNTANVLFDLLGKMGSRGAITAAGDYLSGALYLLLRHLYRRGRGNEELFGVEAGIFDAGAVEADMAASRVRYQLALHGADSQCPAMTAESLTAYPGLGQSVAQVVHNTDERCKKLPEI